MIIHMCAQGSEEWLRLRLGIPTASMFSKIVTPKGALSSQSMDYMNLLIAEWIGGVPVDEFENDWTRHGNDYESEARSAYEFTAGYDVKQVGFITTDDGTIGASPDGMVGDVGLCELKCPKANTHVGYLLNRAIDDKYKPQLQGQLWVCEREWVDIQSYCPGYPTTAVRVERDDTYIEKLADSVRGFVDMMLEARVTLQQKYGPFTREKPATDEYDGMGITDADIDSMLRSGAVQPTA